MENYKFFQNTRCEFFPCHHVKNKLEFNCLFCFCPLYALKNSCGGQFKYLENGVKDCSTCQLPHNLTGYNHIMKHINEMIDLGKIDK